jgi:hypothetical protein
MSSRIILATALLCSGACIAAPNLPELPDTVQRMYIYGASAPAPQEKGWLVAAHTPYHVGITKLGKTQDATVAIEMQDFKLSPPQPSEDFVALIKEQQDKTNDPDRFTVQVHDVTSYKLGDAVCARSHSVSVDKTAKTPTGDISQMLLEVYAVICRHPDQPLMGVNVTYSLRYHEGDRDPQLEQAATAFLDGAKFEPVKK